MYNLEERIIIDNSIDYYILYNNENIGCLNVNLNEEDVFIRHIDIKPEHRRLGHARKIIEYMFENFKTNITFCIATNSESAVAFWDRILKEREHIHIRGNIYTLIYK